MRFIPQLRILLGLNQLGLLALLTLLPSCMTPVPQEKDYITYQKRYSALAQPELDRLEKNYRAGDLSETEYLLEKQRIEQHVTDQADIAVFKSYQYLHSDRRSQGIPTGGAFSAYEGSPIPPPNTATTGGGGSTVLRSKDF